MPQFDKITFFNQIFWLFFFFSGFYLILLNFFLPKLGSVLKARSKKLQKEAEGVFIFSKEQDSVTNLFNISLEEISAAVKSSITKTTDKSDSNISTEITFFNDYILSGKILGLNAVRTSGKIAGSNTFLEKFVYNQNGTSLSFSLPHMIEEDLRLIVSF